MPSAHRSSLNKSKKTKKVASGINVQFAKDITTHFLEMLIVVKLYHWHTHSYSEHKATDDFYSSLNDHMDEFIEILMGKTGKRIEMSMRTCFNTSIDLKSAKTFETKFRAFRDYLIGLDTHAFFSSGSHTDLLNIRDEIVGDLNKLSYLFTLNK
jgi:hypothetical protein